MTRSLSRSPLVWAVALLATASVADAHFLYIIPPQPGEKTVQVVFGEEAVAGEDNRFLSYLDGIVVTDGRQPLALKEATGALVAEGSDTAVYTTTKTVGVMERGGESFLLEYAAKAGSALGGWSWDRETDLPLDIVPTETEDGRVRLTVTFVGKPAEGAEIVFDSEAVSDDGVTDAEGRFTLPPLEAGLVAIRAKHVVNESGEHDGKAYDSVRHYTTLTFHAASSDEQPVLTQASGLAELPEETTSFGATRLGDTLYTYGGHSGDAHSYSREEQNRTLWSLDLSADNAAWTAAAQGEPLQGNALVAVGDRLVLLGGFTARNAAGEDHDLHSLATVRAYDPAGKSWTDLPPLPEPRSSFDADVVGQMIYVAGGWSMQDPADPVWHTTTWKLDLTEASPSWQPAGELPYAKRAVSLTAHDGALYLLGGMTESDGPTTGVLRLDPRSGGWAEAPQLPGMSMNGFGCEAVSLGGQLYATTYDGGVHRLTGDDWETVGQLEKRRFFHRLVPTGETTALVIGGGDMEVGKYTDLDRLTVPNPTGENVRR